MEHGKLYDELCPTEKPNLIELVELAGHDVRPWHFKKDGTPTNGATNSTYCYNWCFEQDGLFILSAWIEELTGQNGAAVLEHNSRKVRDEVKGTKKTRAQAFDDGIRDAWERSMPFCVIINRNKNGKTDKGVDFRRLDNKAWIVASYDDKTGDYLLKRTTDPRPTKPTIYSVESDPELAGFKEGKERRAFVIHRHREARLRAAKIKAHKARNEGRVVYEVPGCGFDFLSVYGEIGRDFAHVHHLLPLSALPDEGADTHLEDLAVVCPNCHAMIHKGGACRELQTLISPQNNNA